MRLRREKGCNWNKAEDQEPWGRQVSGRGWGQSIAGRVGVVAAVRGAGCVPDGPCQHQGPWDSGLASGWWALWSFLLSAGFIGAYGSSLASCLSDWMLYVLTPLHVLLVPSRTWPDGRLGSINFYNLFEGHLERDFDSHKNSITLEPSNLFWGNLSWGNNPVEGKSCVCKAVCCHIVYHCEKLGTRELYFTFVISLSCNKFLRTVFHRWGWRDQMTCPWAWCVEKLKEGKIKPGLFDRKACPLSTRPTESINARCRNG